MNQRLSNIPEKLPVSIAAQCEDQMSLILGLVDSPKHAPKAKATDIRPIVVCWLDRDFSFFK